MGREEIFGLVLVAQPFSKQKKATGLASDNGHGLGVSVFTRDRDSAHAFSRKVDGSSNWIKGKNRLDVRSTAVQDDRGPQMQRLHVDAFENRVDRWRKQIKRIGRI